MVTKKDVYECVMFYCFLYFYYLLVTKDQNLLNHVLNCLNKHRDTTLSRILCRGNTEMDKKNILPSLKFNPSISFIKI